MELNQEQKKYLHTISCRQVAKHLRYHIGKMVVSARIDKGWTLEQASQKMFDMYRYSFGVHTLERIELGKYDLKIWDLVMLAHLYDRSLCINIDCLHAKSTTKQHHSNA